MSIQIKKVYADIHALLADPANQDKKVKALMPQIMEMVTAKQLAKTFILNDKGEVTHVFCYYHKKWEETALVEYGTKQKSASSLNSMCKEGVNQWTKQQREFKKGKEEVLKKVQTGELTPDQIQAELNKLEEATKVIIPREDNPGTDEVPEDYIAP